MAFRVPPSFVPEHLLSNIDPALDQFWHPVAPITELPADGAPLKVELLGKPWVLVTLGQRLVALWDRCPHRLVPLSQGTVVGDRLQCRYHGYEFDADGSCRLIPALGDVTPPAHLGVPRAHVRTAFGLIWLCAADEPAPFPFDSSGEWPYLDPDLDAFIAGPFDTPVSAGLLTDNFLDVTHLAFLHTQTFGDSTPPTHELRVDRHEWSLRQTTVSITSQYGPPVAIRYDYDLQAPFACELKMTALEGPAVGAADYVWSFCQPQAPDRTRWYMVQAFAGLGHDPQKIAAAKDFQTQIGVEDLSILEPMPHPHLPLDNSETHTRGDKGCVAYRQIMKSIASGAIRPTSETGSKQSVAQAS
jgi:phenylpropionate dioxygenase-like ring-hydroxylating dioxygenase large terminal subunit